MSVDRWWVRLVGPDGKSTVKTYGAEGLDESAARTMADRKTRQYPHLGRAGLEFVAERKEGEG